MSEAKGVLFSHWDGGRGHIQRVLDVAEQVKKRGFRIGLITTEAIKHSLPFEFDGVYITPTRPPVSANPEYELPLYSHARSHGQRLLGLGFNKDFVVDTNMRELRVVEDFKPDIIVNDYRDTIKNVTDLKQIPLVGIVQSNGHLGGQELGWFIDVGDPYKPSCLNEFNEARLSLGLDAISDEREMFMGDCQIIPSIAEIDPVGGQFPSTHYVGLLSHNSKVKKTDDEWSQDLLNDFVVGNITSSNRKYYGQDNLMEDIPERLRIDVVSVGDPSINTGSIQRRFGRFISRRYVNYDQILPNSRAFISYGGHGSTLSALMHGVPIVGVGPFSSEQRGTLENIQAFGAGVVIPHEAQLESLRAADMSNANIYGNWSSSITTEQIVDMLSKVADQDSYAVKSMELAIKLRKGGGSKKATDIIIEQI